MSTKGATTSNAIRKTALALFSARGYAAISMRDIAEAVKRQPAAIYNHFPTKQAILLDLMAGHLNGLIEAWRAEPQAGDAADRFEAFARFHLRYHFERPDEVFLSYMELRSLEPSNFATIATLRRTYEGFLRAILQEAMATGLASEGDASVRARAVIAMLNGVTTWFRPDGRLSAAEVRDIYVDMARRSVGLGGRSEREAEESACSTAA